MVFIWMFLGYNHSFSKIDLSFYAHWLWNDMQCIVTESIPTIILQKIYYSLQWRNHVAVFINLWYVYCICCLNYVFVFLCEALCRHLDQDSLKEEILYFNGTFLVKERINKHPAEPTTPGYLCCSFYIHGSMQIKPEKMHRSWKNVPFSSSNVMRAWPPFKRNDGRCVTVNTDATTSSLSSPSSASRPRINFTVFTGILAFICIQREWRVIGQLQTSIHIHHLRFW